MAKNKDPKIHQLKGEFTVKNKKNGDAFYSVTLRDNEWNNFKKRARNKIISGMDIKGFRKGAVPPMLAKRYISEDIVLRNAAKDALYSAYMFAMNQKTELKPMNMEKTVPAIENITEDHVTFTFTFSLRPEVKLGKYKNLKIESKKPHVSDKEADNEIKNKIKKFSEYIPSKTATAKIFDVVIIDFEGKINKKPFKGGNAKDYELELGSKQFIEGFEKNIVGMKAGSKKSFKLKFPEDYPSRDLADKEVFFTVQIKEVRKIKFPAVDKKLLKKLNINKVNTESELKKHLKTELMMRQKTEIENDYNSELLSVIIEESKFTISDKIIDFETDKQLEQLQKKLKERKIKMDDYLKMQKMPYEILKGEIKDDIETRFELEMVLLEISKKEKLKFDKKDFNEFFIAVKKQNSKVTKEQVQKQIDSDPTIQMKLHNEKIMRWLKKNNQVVFKELLVENNYKVDNVPVIITRGVVVFPEHNTIIEIGRLKTVNACNKAIEEFDGQVLVVSQKNPSVENPEQKDIYQVGTLCRARLIKRWEENSMRVTVTGTNRAKIIEMNDENDMFSANIKILNSKNIDVTEENALVRQLAKSIEEMASRLPVIPQEIINQLSQGISAGELADTISHYLTIPLDKKQKILETLDINKRLKLVLNEIEEERNINKIEDKISKKIRTKIDESQREYYLREKLRAIKEELGEISPQGDDSEEIRKRVDKEPFPKAVKDRIYEELKRFELTPPASSESSIIRTYIDWLLNIPWYQETKDKVDLQKAAKILDKNHWGLKKIKERIIEYLAVLKKTKSLAGQIICLVGPPGVGKTSLARSIADATNRNFVKISLGGVKDESEIRGHRRTYIASLPGRIIQGMKKAKTVNPLFLIDEIDKMASDFRGDPSSAMLEVLDPEQNSQFSDHYIEEPYDLSRVMFLATANSLEDIPAPLLDRMEIIQLSSYTEQEKTQITSKHLMKKVLEKHGLTKEEFSINKQAVLEIIQYYTKEAGVRQIDRTLSKIARKMVLEILEKKKIENKITPALLEHYLSKRIFNFTKKLKKADVGVVTGLAYTSYGGDILPIEVTYFKSKEGKLSLTGQLGDVMQESAAIALSYIKANYKAFKIKYDLFESNTIHLHVPEGAIPKDGPSAGVTLTTAMISALTNKAVGAGVAMTGEITLRGKVLPIGGLREKLISAHRSKLKVIFIPKENLKDLDDVPKEVLNGLDIIPVSEYKEIYKKVFENV